jgi:methyl-accepting chemotaxis protein
MRLTIRLTIIAGQLALALLVAGFAWLGLRTAEQGEERLRALYEERVVPLRHLKTVSDAYAVFVVDATHKVRNGNWSWAEGEASVRKAQGEIAEGWRAYYARPSRRRAARSLRPCRRARPRQMRSRATRSPPWSPRTAPRSRRSCATASTRRSIH